MSTFGSHKYVVAWTAYLCICICTVGRGVCSVENRHCPNKQNIPLDRGVIKYVRENIIHLSRNKYSVEEQESMEPFLLSVRVLTELLFMSEFFHRAKSLYIERIFLLSLGEETRSFFRILT